MALPDSVEIECMDVTTMLTYDGDSGGPVFVIDRDNLVFQTGIMIGRSNDSSHSYVSPMGQIHTALGAFTITRPTNLTAPSLSGSLSGSWPVPHWNPVSGATVYYLYRAWRDNDNSVGSTGPEYIGSASDTLYLDPTLNASAYNGSSIPGPHTHGYISYYVLAYNSRDRSGGSATKYFTLAP